MKAIIDAAVGGIPLLIPVIGLVVYLKKFGVAGKGLLASSMALGLGLGVGYQLAVLPAQPTEFGEWFAIGIFGLTLGLVASGIYDVGDDWVSKIAALLQRGNTLTALSSPATAGTLTVADVAGLTEEAPHG